MKNRTFEESEMTQEEAQRIAELLNTRNQLQIAYRTDKILQQSNDYIFEFVTMP